MKPLTLFPRILSGCTAALLLSSLVVSARETPSHWLEQEQMSGDWLGWRSRLAERGVEFSANLTAEGWGNVSGGLERGATYTGLVDFSLTLDLEKAIGWKGATLHQSWFAPHGRDLSGERVGNDLTVSNAAAYNSLYLYELWLEQRLFEDRLSLRMGQLAADGEFAGSDYGGLFINATFGWPPFLSGNLPNVGPAFPKGTLGVRLAITPIASITFQSALFQGDPFEDTLNRHGTRWQLGSSTGYLWMNEWQGRWNQSGEGHSGGLKIGLWYHSGRFEHPHASVEAPRRGNYGVYGIIDQMLFRPVSEDDSEGRGLGWFARAGINPQDRNPIGFYFDTGLNWKGLLPSRKDDTLGIAFGCAKLSEGARRTLANEGMRTSGYEAVVELTYQCQITPWLVVQPDVQCIFHPGCHADVQTALVVGARLVLAF